MELTDPLREYIETKVNSLEKYLKNFDQDTLMAQVEVARTTKHHKQGDVFYAEVNLSLPGNMLRADYKADDVRVAIDKVRSILQREIRKYKDQLRP